MPPVVKESVWPMLEVKVRDYCYHYFSGRLHVPLRRSAFGESDTFMSYISLFCLIARRLGLLRLQRRYIEEKNR